MLKLIGLGLSADLITLGGLLGLLECKRILIDVYTSIWFPNIELLIETLRKLGKDVIAADRGSLEGKSIDVLAELSVRDEVCIAVIGDPMIATTHSSLVVEALRRGAEVEIIPSTTILSAAISFSCLQAYKFGKSVTLVRPREGIVFEYPLHVIEENRKRNLHTILLLDLDVFQGYYMTPSEAARLLLEIQKRIGRKVVNEDDDVIVLGAIGSEHMSIEVKSLYVLAQEKDNKYRAPPYTIVIPSKNLHPLEEECLELVKRGKMYFRVRITVDKLREILKVLNTVKSRESN